MSSTRPRIAIIGGNFAGLTAAAALSPRHAVTVIDPSRHFEWVPAIHEILSSVKTPQALRLDRAAIVRQAGHSFLRDRVTALQPGLGRLQTTGGRDLAFDACIVALGAEGNTGRVPGAQRHALPFRNVDDAQAIERRLKALWRPGQPLRVVIAGGGIAGVEAVGELLRRHRDDSRLSVQWVEAGPRLLPGLPASLDADLRRLCAPHAVTIRTGTGIAAVAAKSVRLADGTRLRSDLTLWSAGLAAPALLREAGLATPPQTWAEVLPTLQSRHADNVFVAGDAALLPQPLGKQAYHAIDMGALAAANVQRWLAGQALRRFRPAPKPVLIAFGDLQTYLVAGRTVVASKLLAGAKEGIYQWFMAQREPSSLAASLPSAAGRMWTGWQQLAVPQLLSLAGFRALPDCRTLRQT